MYHRKGHENVTRHNSNWQIEQTGFDLQSAQAHEGLFTLSKNRVIGKKTEGKKIRERSAMETQLE